MADGQSEPGIPGILLGQSFRLSIARRQHPKGRPDDRLDGLDFARLSRRLRGLWRRAVSGHRQKCVRSYFGRVGLDGTGRRRLSALLPGRRHSDSQFEHDWSESSRAGEFTLPRRAISGDGRPGRSVYRAPSDGKGRLVLWSGREVGLDRLLSFGLCIGGIAHVLPLHRIDPIPGVSPERLYVLYRNLFQTRRYSQVLRPEDLAD